MRRREQPEDRRTSLVAADCPAAGGRRKDKRILAVVLTPELNCREREHARSAERELGEASPRIRKEVHLGEVRRSDVQLSVVQVFLLSSSATFQLLLHSSSSPPFACLSQLERLDHPLSFCHNRRSARSLLVSALAVQKHTQSTTDTSVPLKSCPSPRSRPSSSSRPLGSCR